MNGRSRPIVPEADHTAEDFDTANQTVAAARERLRANPASQAAADRVTQLADEIADRRVHTLASLRKAQELTQVQIAETLGIGQGDVSKMEQRQNLMLQTLARYVEATGGRLRILAEYGDDRVEVDLGSVGSQTAVDDHPGEGARRGVIPR
jgi:DNA-binding transcriptional regulator YiaG